MKVDLVCTRRLKSLEKNFADAKTFMSRRKLKALLDSQESLPTTTTTRRRPLRRGTMADTEEQSEPSAEVTREMQELRAMVEDLQVQLREAQDAITASDEQLTRVSGECERVYSEARVVSDLVGGLTGGGPSSLQSVF